MGNMSARTKNPTVKIFADGANLDSIREFASNDLVKGFTTNPTLMRQAGVDDYLEFAQQALEVVGDRPISLEVFSDEPEEMKRQAIKLASLGSNVNVKVPITNSEGLSSLALIRELSNEGVTVNVTAIFTYDQAASSLEALQNGMGGYISIFAGRIADTGRDPIPLMARVASLLMSTRIDLIWASPRELLNVFQAADSGCHVITVPPDILRKWHLVDKDLTTYSLETVKMFSSDAQLAGYEIR